MMLQNEREVQNTAIQLTKMEQVLVEAQENLAARSDLPAIVREGYLNGIRALIGDRKAELAQYEAPHSGEMRAIPMLVEMPAALVVEVVSQTDAGADVRQVAEAKKVVE